MITFAICLFALVAGYFAYGGFVERVFGVKPDAPTPAYAMEDGVDYVPMPWWRVFLIQFLNIAGLGPIFGAIMGMMFGPASFLWIVVGTIFAGAVHDYLSGMMSIRRGGASLPELVGDELGGAAKSFMRLFALLLMVLVGAVFVSGPAGLLAGLLPQVGAPIWMAAIFAYYILATLLPIDKLIGRIYPVFGFALLFMAAGILFALFYNHAPVVEVAVGVGNRHPDPAMHIFPMMFVSIACGAISGFHATQAPLMARCIKNERYGRRCFYGAMVAEGVVALVWAAAASSFFGSLDGLQSHVAALPATANKGAEVVDAISKAWLGGVGGFLAILGVVAAPITSGDTALRSARLIAADFLHFDQKPLWKRLAVSIPIFIVTFAVLQMDFDVLWRYFAWCNQTLAVFTLWTATAYLRRQGKLYAIALAPAIFMTMVCSTYIFAAPRPEGAGLSYETSLAIGGAVTALATVCFFRRKGGR
ncbi:MAG: carbon starvation protein A [Acidobacteriota bacterium]|jgi:carbon starvation protein CstA|nr:carbon starvation protein A [Acidobacteriota bacterium]